MKIYGVYKIKKHDFLGTPESICFCSTFDKAKAATNDYVNHFYGNSFKKFAWNKLDNGLWSFDSIEESFTIISHELDKYFWIK